MRSETSDVPDEDDCPGQADGPLSSDDVEEMAYMRQELSDTRRILRLNAEVLTTMLVELDPGHAGLRSAFAFVSRDLWCVRHVLSALADVEKEQERARFPDRVAQPWEAKAGRPGPNGTEVGEIAF